MFISPCSFKNICFISFETVLLYAYKSRTTIWKKLSWLHISNTHQDNKPKKKKKKVLRDNGSNALYSPYESLFALLKSLEFLK